MNKRADYEPGSADGAEIRRDGGRWTLLVVRSLRHPPAAVWEALTDPSQLREWAPFDADRSLAQTGPVTLTTVGAPEGSEGKVTRAEAPRLLEYTWGQFEMRWELEAAGDGTRLTLWQNIDRRYIAWGAAGWHVCFDVLEHLLRAEPMGRIVGPEAMKLSGWQRLSAEYAAKFDSTPETESP